MSAGVGIADFEPLAAAAPTSLAYSGSIAAPLPAVGMVATCQTATMPTKISNDSSAARNPSDPFSDGTRSAPLDGEAGDVVLGLGGIERLAQDHHGLPIRMRRRR